MTAVTKNSSAKHPAPLTTEEKRGITEAELAWDLSLQIAALRDLRGVSQEHLAALLETKQQAISRLDDPTYAGHSLRYLREYAAALDAYVDVTIVPQDKIECYLANRYQPVLVADVEEGNVASNKAPGS